MLSTGASKKVADLGVAGLGEIQIVGSDRVEGVWYPEADQLVTLLSKLGNDLSRRDRNSENQSGRMVSAYASQSRLHGSASGDSIIDHHDRASRDGDGRTTLHISLPAPLDLVQLPAKLRGQILPSRPQLPHDGFVEDNLRFGAVYHRPYPELLMTGCGKLPDEQQVEFGPQCAGHLERHRDPAPGKRQDERVQILVGKQRIRKCPPRFPSISEAVRAEHEPAPLWPQMFEEPPRSMRDHQVERAGLFEQVAGAGHDHELVKAIEVVHGLPVQADDRCVPAADDQ